MINIFSHKKSQSRVDSRSPFGGYNYVGAGFTPKHTDFIPKLYRNENTIGACTVHNCQRVTLLKEVKRGNGWRRVGGTFEVCPRCINILRLQAEQRDFASGELYRFKQV